MHHDKSIKIAVVGDVHDSWDADDAVALKHLDVDLVLFVGDFGNESVEVVRAIADIDLPKAAIFGNHDAWYSASDWGKSSAPTIALKRIGSRNRWICWEPARSAMASWTFQP